MSYVCVLRGGSSSIIRFAQDDRLMSAHAFRVTTLGFIHVLCHGSGNLLKDMTSYEKSLVRKEQVGVDKEMVVYV